MINLISHALALFTFFAFAFTSPVPPFKNKPPSIKPGGPAPFHRTTCPVGTFVNKAQMGGDPSGSINSCLPCPAGQYNSLPVTNSKICSACLNKKTTCSRYTGL